MLNFDFTDYSPFHSGDQLHLIPKNDVDTHHGVDCKCDPIMIKVETKAGDSKTVAYLHQAYDMREYVDIIPNLKLEEAIIFRKKYKENLNSFVKKGNITQGKANMKGFEFNSLFEEIFKTN